MRLTEGGDPPIFLQDGKAWSEGGDDPIERAALPLWFDGAVARLSVKARQEVGWRVEGDPPLPEPVMPVDAVGAGKKGSPRIGRPRG